MGTEADVARTDPAADDSAAEQQADSEQASATAANETVLSLAEAARTVGLSERALRKHIQRGTLASRTLVRNGRAIAAVELEELKRRYGPLEMVPTATVAAAGDGSQRGTRLRSTRELSQKKRLRELTQAGRELEARLGKLRALLGMERAQKREMQRQMQFLADSLARAEARLEASQEEARKLTLQLGVAQGRADELRRGLEEAREVRDVSGRGLPPVRRSATVPASSVPASSVPTSPVSGSPVSGSPVAG